MSDNYQREIPRARVNIALELETNGAAKKSELPLKMLVVGEYSNNPDDTELAERQRIGVSKNNLEQVLKELSPTSRFPVADKISGEGQLNVALQFGSFGDFDPDNVASQVPELNKLMAMRNLLRDLRSNLLDNLALRKELEKVLKNKPQLQQLKANLDDLVPLETNNNSSIER